MDTHEPQDAPLESARHGANQDGVIVIADYPQLLGLAWNRGIGATCSESEALALYERNWRFVEQADLTPREQAFIDRIVKHHGNGVLLV